MKIEAGKYYRTRDGRRVGPLKLKWPTHIENGRWGIDGASRQWNDAGRMWSEYGGQTDGDLIAEWTDAPDLTALTTPFGLLDRETQEALKAHGGPFQLWGGHLWLDRSRDQIGVFDNWYCYRVKPAQPKPREWWLLVRANGDIKAHPEKITACGCHDQIVHVREVLPETN